MENDSIPGKTPQGNRTHSTSSSSSSTSHCHSLKDHPRFPSPHTRLVCMKHTSCGHSWCVYINKSVIRLHWHYPTQRDNNVTSLSTLHVLLEWAAPRQEAEARSSRASPQTATTTKQFFFLHSLVDVLQIHQDTLQSFQRPLKATKLGNKGRWVW